MKVLRKYWWLLLTLLVVTLIFIINYQGVMQTLEWNNKPFDVLGKLAVKLIIVGALLDQFIAVFFPENDETQLQRTEAETTLSLNREKRKIIRKEMLHERLNFSDGAKSENFAGLKTEHDRSDSSIRQAVDVLTEINSERIGFVRMVAFAFSLVLAITGITVLTDFIVMPGAEDLGFNHKLISYLDIILTAALISGGTSGINQFFKVVRDSWKKNGLNT